MGLLVNIDNGGTFTDICVSDGNTVSYVKSPTTPHDLTKCFVDIMTRASQQIYGDADLTRLIQNIDYLRYSTTSGTNAIVEQRGASVGLLVDSGEEKNIYGYQKELEKNSLWNVMVPSLPRGIPIEGEEIDEERLVAIVNDLLSTGISRLVVSLSSIESELKVKDALLESYPRHLLGAVPFLISHELSADREDGRRTFTAVINSFLHPGMEHFLYGAENVCKNNYMKRPLLIFRNDGDSARVAKTTAIKTWGSGPRGGLDGSIQYAQYYASSNLVSMDIGGTTTDISIVREGKESLTRNGKIGGVETSFDLPSLQSFGLGGSSVIRVNEGRIIIGPESVGVNPGPASFGRGGTEATLTDALLMLGIIDPKTFSGGEIALDMDRATKAVEAIGGLLGLDAGNAASLILKEFSGQVAARLRELSTDRGIDLSTASLLAYGGCGPMVACSIARSSGIKKVIVPNLSSVFSAFGLGFSDIAHEYQMIFDRNSDIRNHTNQMSERAARDMFGEGVDPQECRYSFSQLEIKNGVLSETTLDDKSLKEGAEVRLRASYELPRFDLENLRTEAAGGNAEKARTSDVKKESTGGLSIFKLSELVAGREIFGPGLILADYLTCFIEKSWRLVLTKSGDLIMELKSDE